jgi:NADPH:quinone reductase-like Zn-dependent oxidoreductase
MNAVRIHEYGGPEVLVIEETEKPVAGDGEVLVRIRAAGVNPVDWKVRQGYLQDFLSPRLPLVLGWDFAGTIEEVGPGVTSLQPGTAVYGHPVIGRDGTYAEFIALKADFVAPKPETLTFEEAAAVPLAALTAWQALFEVARLRTGQKILIHGAAGGVGHFAVQFARWCGAHVIGTASSRHHVFLNSIGIHELIDYPSTRFEAKVHDLDVVFDTMSGEVRSRSWQVLKKGGILVTTLGPEPEDESRQGYEVRYQSIFVRPDGAQLGEIAALIDAGQVKPHLAAVLPLGEVRQAHALSEEGHTQGKIVLRI